MDAHATDEKAISSTHVEVRTDDLHQCRIAERPVPVPTDGEAVLHLQHAALTANNITYGAFGAAMGYWRFFPTDDGWGRIPLWGFAEVVASRAEGVHEGDRFYGYLPMSTHLVVEPARVTPHGFVDGAAHRTDLPAVYNQYQRVTGSGDVHAEHLTAVLRPLFTTSFLIDDWLADESFFGATSVVVGSASSKTSLALAASLTARPDAGIEVVGLTSERNAAFVAGVGLYDRTVVYGSVSDLDPATPTVFVDMGGDAAVISEVHHHFADQLRHSCQVGATHWDRVGPTGTLPGPAPSFFFAPTQVARRVRDWGSRGFDERVEGAWGRFVASAGRWLTIVEHSGPDAVVAAYLDVLDGRVAPDQGYVITLDH